RGAEEPTPELHFLVGLHGGSRTTPHPPRCLTEAPKQVGKFMGQVHKPNSCPQPGAHVNMTPGARAEAGVPTAMAGDSGVPPVPDGCERRPSASRGTYIHPIARPCAATAKGP